MNKTVILDFDLVGFHKWENAPEEVDFLSYKHRHNFRFRLGYKVTAFLDCVEAPSSQSLSPQRRFLTILYCSFAAWVRSQNFVSGVHDELSDLYSPDVNCAAVAQQKRSHCGSCSWSPLT